MPWQNYYYIFEDEQTFSKVLYSTQFIYFLRRLI